MKLGFWSRLTIVAMLAAVAVIPTFIIYSHNISQAMSRAVDYSTCIDIAMEQKSAAKLNECERASNLPADLWGRVEWFSIAFITVGLTGILISLVWLASFVVRWVRRG